MGSNNDANRPQPQATSWRDTQSGPARKRQSGDSSSREVPRGYMPKQTPPNPRNTTGVRKGVR